MENKKGKINKKVSKAKWDFKNKIKIIETKFKEQLRKVVNPLAEKINTSTAYEVARNFYKACVVLSTVLMVNIPLVYASSTGMDFFNSGIDIMEMIIIAIGAVILIMGIINYLESYANDNPGSKSQGQKQFIAGAGIIIVGILLIPELKTLITI